jgi:ABC-type antimicrobial peptide transport system permease subunit
VLVNESFARKHFGAESPIGHRLRAREGDSWRTIIGVVPDTMMQGPLEQRRDGSGIFVPIEALPLSYLTLVVRGHEPAGQLIHSLRRELAKVEPYIPIYNLDTPRNHLVKALSQTRTVVSLFSIFAVVSIFLAAIGLYGVMSFTVSRRTTEFGIRMALGARARDVMRMVLVQGGKQLAAGVLVGVGLSQALVRFSGSAVTGFLYQVNAGDPVIHITVVILLSAAAIAACFFPALRATRVDPMAALRCE